MKFAIEREQLRGALDAIVPVISTKTTLPVLGNVLLQARDGAVKFVATDLDTGISVSAPSETATIGDALVPAKRLQEIAKQMPDGAIRFAAAGDDRVTVESGKSRFKLMGLPTVEFPSFPKLDFPGTAVVPAGAVRQMIDGVSFAAARDDSRGAICGVSWEFGPKTMRMVATNGHRLALMTSPGGSAKAQLIVPPKALDLFRRIYTTDDVAVQVATSPTHIGFLAGETFLFSRLIEGPYPNYSQVLPKENNRSVIVDRAALLAAVRRVSIIADSQTKSVRITGSTAGLKVAVKTPDLGEASDEVAGAWEGESIEIGFNASYLMEILKQAPTDQVKLTFKAPERPATIEPVGESTWYGLLMPLRLVA
jgi:DNA polymerase-3 subunit beta